jgi:phospholipid transport system substrate-binding protein
MLAAAVSMAASGCVLAAILAIAPRALGATEPMALVKGTVDEVVKLLQDPALKSDPDTRRQKLKDSVVGHFDFADMARSALGYHWRDLSDQQRKDFVDLFTRFIEAAYLSKIENYSGQQIEYVKAVNEDAGYSQVNTNVIMGEGKDPIGINYRLKMDGGDWKVYDVTVDNISITSNYRNQFNRVINNKGFDALMDDMRAKQQGLDNSIAN